MCRLSFFLEDRLQKVDDVAAAQAGLGAFAHGLGQQFTRACHLRIAAAMDRGVRDERAEALAAVDDALALELFVRALDRDDADEEVFGELPEGGERRAGRDAAFADLPREAVDDLPIERAGARCRERGKDELLRGTHT